MKALFISTLAVLLMAPGAFGKHYQLDKEHLQVGFKVSHLVISTVNGRFDEFTGSFDFNPTTGKLENLSAKIDIDSINTNETKRDIHLKGPDFFGVRTKDKKLDPKKRWMTFTTSKVVNKKKKPTEVHGLLSMNGKSKKVVMKVAYKGSVTDPWGNEKVAFSAKTEINRKDFGLNWSKKLDSGGLVVGNTVKIHIEGEANAQAPKSDKKQAKN